MWCVSKDAQALLIYDLGALTLLEADGSLHSCSLPGSDMQAVLREQDILVRFTDTEDGGIYLSRLDRSTLQELERRELGEADRRLEAAFTGLVRFFSPRDILTPERFFRLAFQPREETGSRYEWELEQEDLTHLWLSWMDVPGGELHTWDISAQDIQGQLPGGTSETAQAFGDVECMEAWGTKVYLLMKLYNSLDSVNALVEADVEAQVCRILWAENRRGNGREDWFGGMPRVLDPERGIQWTFAHAGEAGRPADDGMPEFTSLVPRRLELDAPILEGEPVWERFPIGWPEDLIMLNGKIWVECGSFYGRDRDGRPTDDWFTDPEDVLPNNHVHICGVWQGQLVFLFDDGRLAATPAQLDPPAPEDVRWLRDAREEP